MEDEQAVDLFATCRGVRQLLIICPLSHLTLLAYWGPSSSMRQLSNLSFIAFIKLKFKWMDSALWPRDAVSNLCRNWTQMVAPEPLVSLDRMDHNQNRPHSRPPATTMMTSIKSQKHRDMQGGHP